MRKNCALVALDRPWRNLFRVRVTFVEDVRGYPMRGQTCNSRENSLQDRPIRNDASRTPDHGDIRSAQLSKPIAAPNPTVIVGTVVTVVARVTVVTVDTVSPCPPWSPWSQGSIARPKATLISCVPLSPCPPCPPVPRGHCGHRGHR